MPPALEILVRHTPEAGPVDWDVMIVGYDFSLVTPEEVLAWIRIQPCAGASFEPQEPLAMGVPAHLERLQWAACAEATGSVPRPGHLRWQRA